MEIEKSIFREYDIRGEYPDQINSDVFRKIAHAIAAKCKSENINEICIGRDGRISGEVLLESIINGITESGINVINVGLVTTPVLYYAAKKSNSKSGIMVTGSHNPKNHNGIKLVINDKPVSGNEIYALMQESFDVSENSGEVLKKDFKSNYIDEVYKNLNLPENNKIKVVIDCGNGAAGCIAPELYKKLGCEVIEIFSEIDGNFPNHHPDPGDPKNLEDLIRIVKKENADLGLAFDGDGDRVGLVTNNGEIVFPDRILMMFSKDILSKKSGSIIFDVKCSNVLSEIIFKHGGTPIMSPTGHFHIKNGIKKHDPLIAGEMSGHIFFNDKWYGFDDGHYSGARVIELIHESSKTISDLNDELPKLFSTPEISIKVSDDEKFDVIEKFKKECTLDGEKVTIDGLRINFNNGWGLIRASNTTPKLVCRFEANNEKNLKKIYDDFIDELSRICPNIGVNLH